MFSVCEIQADGCVSNGDSHLVYDADGNQVGDPYLGGYDNCGRCNGSGSVNENGSISRISHTQLVFDHTILAGTSCTLQSFRTDSGYHWSIVDGCRSSIGSSISGV